MGKRETHIYGSKTFIDYLEELKAIFKDTVELTYFQSNHEGGIIDFIHEHLHDQDGMVINPAAYTHTSVAIADALVCVTYPLVEVHISNIYEREAFRHHSYVKPLAAKTIVGQGLNGYKEAIDFLLLEVSHVKLE